MYFWCNWGLGGEVGRCQAWMRWTRRLMWWRWLGGMARGRGVAGTCGWGLVSYNWRRGRVPGCASTMPGTNGMNNLVVWRVGRQFSWRSIRQLQNPKRLSLGLGWSWSVSESVAARLCSRSLISHSWLRNLGEPLSRYPPAWWMHGLTRVGWRGHRRS